MKIAIRPEQPADCAAIHRVLVSSTEQEANLVDRLRRNNRLMISLVTESAGEVVGHVVFSAVTIDGARANGVGLAPLAVLPQWQIAASAPNWFALV